MTDRNTVRGEREREKDPTQKALSKIDTSIDLVSRFSVGDVKYFVPAIAVGLFGVALFIIGFPAATMLVTTIIACLLSLIAAAMVLMSHEFTNPREILIGWKEYLLIRLSHPITDTVAAKLRIHGVRRGFDDGSFEHDDGTLVMLKRMEGRTTDELTYAELDPIVARLSKNIDENIQDFGFKLFSPTTDHDIEEVVESYDERAYNGVLDRAKGYLGEAMRSFVEWCVDVDEPAKNPKETTHYVAIRVGPDDIESSTASEDGEKSPRHYRWLISHIPVVHYLYRKIIGTPWKHDGDGPSFVERKRIQSELYDRARIIERQMVAGIDGVEMHDVSIEEHAAILLRYWTGRNHHPDETLERKFNRGNFKTPAVWQQAHRYKSSDQEVGDLESAVGSERAQRQLRTAVPNEHQDTLSGSDMMLVPGYFDVQNGYVQVGDQYVTGLWVAEFPPEIESGFMKEIYDLNAAAEPEDPPVNYSVTFDVTPVPKQQAIKETKDGEVDAGAKSGEQSNVDSRHTQKRKKTYTDAVELLEDTNAQAWDVSAYVLVRVGHEATKAFVEENEHLDFETYDEAKIKTLEAAVERMEKKLASTPCEATTLKPSRMQHEIFKSASPNLGNPYNDVYAEGEKGIIQKKIGKIMGDTKTSGPKQQRVLGGFLGAAFPPGAATINEEGGLWWGRDNETDLPFRTDPTQRNTGGHMVTNGVNRSGKTYGAQNASIPWFAERDDRYLVACDTKGEFDGFTQLLGGEHYVIEGDTTLNPLAFYPPRDGVYSGDVDYFWMAVNTRTSFFKNIIKAQGVDPSEYHSDISQGIEITYKEFGIEPGDVEPDERMPNVNDLLETWKRMQSDPGEFSFSESEEGDESEEESTKERTVGRLLDKLSGFRPGGKYENFLGDSNLGLLDDDVRMAYIDLSQLDTDNDAEKSAMLSLCQHLVTQKVRQSQGELIFLIDEAHLLLHSNEQVDWLQKGMREWARDDSYLWLITQHLSELIEANDASEGNKKSSMIDQVAQFQLYNMPMRDDTTLREFVPLDSVADTVQNDLTAARERRGFTECIIWVTDNDKPGVHRVTVEACPLIDHALNYDRKEVGEDFDTYMQRFLHNDALAPVEELFLDEAMERAETKTQQHGLQDLYAQASRMEERAEEVMEQRGVTAGDVLPPRDENGRFIKQERGEPEIGGDD